MSFGARAVRPIHDERGFILITALWLLIALGAVGLNAALHSRTERLAAANLLDQTRARAAATAGAEYARSRLTAAMFEQAEELRAESRSSQNRNRTQSVQALFRNADPSEDPWRNPEELVQPEMTFGNTRFQLYLRDSGAALNLNMADEQMIRGFFSLGLRVDYALADRLTQAILDWRDADELPRVGGGEREEYLRSGAVVLPPNRAFAEVAELTHVLGMTQEIYEAARPYLTLTSSARVNLNAAPEAVLLALPGMTEAAATEIIRLRETDNLPSNTEELLRILPRGAGAGIDDEERRFNDRVSFRTTEVEIISDGRVDGSAIQARVRMVVSRSNTGAVVLTREFN